MRFPFISRRRHETAVRVATAAIWHFVEQAEDQTTAELERRLNAEYALTDAHKELAQERAKRERIKAYVLRSHSGRYETRLARALRAVAALRAEAAVQRRVVDRLTDQLLDATGHIGEPLLPAARVTLGLDKEDA
jgi:hypothetical protein